MQAVREHLAALSSGTGGAQLAAAAWLAELLEAEEARYRDVVGDPYGNPSGRNGHSIGRLLGLIKVGVGRGGGGQLLGFIEVGVGSGVIECVCVGGGQDLQKPISLTWTPGGGREVKAGEGALGGRAAHGGGRTVENSGGVQQPHPHTCLHTQQDPTP